MNAIEIVTELEHAGIRLWEEAGELRFRAPRGVLTEDRRATLRANKEEVLDALRSQSQALELRPQPEQWNEPFPLTDVQAAYLFGRHDAFGLGGVACHMYVELEFDELEPARLEQAWNRLIARHDMLRAVVAEDGSQRVLAQVPAYRVGFVDLRGSDPQRSSSATADVRAEMGHCLRDPGTWPLFELRITRLQTSSTLHLSIDFIIADWASIQLLLGELELGYHEPAKERPALDIAFRDYVLAERGLRESNRFDRDRAYWHERIDELPGAPALPLIDRPPTDVPARFRRWSCGLTAVEWSALRAQASARGITASGAVLAAFAEVIGAWSRHQRFTLNLTLLNRLPLHAVVDRLVGDFTSVSMLAVDNERGGSFGERATQLGAQLFEDLDHRLFSGVEVLREIARRRDRDAARMPVVFTSAIGLDETASRAGSAPRARLGYGITQTPQVSIDCQAMSWEGELRLNWDVREGVFPDGLIDDMFAAFDQLLRRLAIDPQAWESELPVALPDVQSERRRRVNDTATSPSDALLHEPVLAQALREPERIAVLSGQRSLTYAELVDRATSVAGALHEQGCRPGDLVAVLMDKGCEQVVAVLGVLLAGAAWLPIDTNQPAARRERMMADAGVRHVLTQSWLGTAPVRPGTAPARPATAPARPGTEMPIAVDRLDPAIPAPAMPARTAAPDDLAYVIFTSGSTGRPKGVMVSHRSAVNTIDDINRRFGISAGDRVLALANLAFDLAVYDIFGPLARGACIVIPDAERRADPSHWAQLIAEHRISVWNSVPTQLQMLHHFLASEPGLELPWLRIALVSGDWIPVALPAQIRARVPSVRLISLGGATEAAIWSIYHPIDEVPPEWRSIPYGKPLANQTFHVLASGWRPCPDLTTGELYIGGLGVAQGYLGDEEKTAARFVTHPRTGERLYRTGDLGRYLPDGTIEFLGREDSQVKIRGHRVELGEVEAALQCHPAVGAAAVIVQGGEVLRQSLVGFVTNARRGEPADVSVLADHAAQHLPPYMLPAQIHVIDALPLTGNGKLDRGALGVRAAELSGDDASGDDEPRTDLERRLAPLWAEVLGLPRFGRDQDFFRSGGDSLSAAKLIGKIREQIPEAAGLFFDSLVRQLLPAPTVAALAAHLEGQRRQRPQSPAAALLSPLVVLAGSGAGTTRVLVHDGTGRLAPYRELAAVLSEFGPVVGLAINEAQSYLHWEPAVLIERRATSYARLLEAHGHRRVHVVGCGLGWPLAVELARQLAENGVDVDGLTVLDGHALPAIGTPGAIEGLLARELGADPQLAPLPQWPGVDVVEDVEVLREVFTHTLRAAAEYRPSPYLGDMTWVRPSDGDATGAEGPPCLGELRVVDLPRDGATGSPAGPRPSRLAELMLESEQAGTWAAR